MAKRLISPALLFALAFGLAAVPTRAAEPSSAAGKKRSSSGYKLSYTPIYQFESDMDAGGKFAVQRHFLRFGTNRFINRNWMVGLGLGFDYEQWDFTSAAGLAGVSLWDDIFRTSISIPIFYSPGNQWRFGFIPTADFAGASGAEVDESASYGAVLTAAYTVGDDLTVGFGAGLFERLDQTEAFPFLVIDWQISDRLQLTNPFEAGPVGPAGLELIYTPNDRWEIGVGGAYRSYRFRLDDSSTVADGIGEVDFTAPFVRVGRQLGKQWRLNINGGATIDGSITIEDKDANELGSTDYDTAPFVGIMLECKF